MNWETLLNTERVSELEIPSEMTERYLTSQFELDYWRIVNSAPFRHLQDKTQVFPLDKSDFVRTRLTHSMETSAIAKQLTTMIGNNIRGRAETKYPITEAQVKNAANAAMCAGLLHDIGNPPFGHFGEMAISNWFIENGDKLCYKGTPISQVLGEKRYKDLCSFEGNAQALRLLSKVYRVDGCIGMNLTPAVLNILVKYPGPSSIMDKESPDVRLHKFGFFTSEADIFDAVATHTGTKMGENDYRRHPLTYILEAADDIAYATADMEDAYEKKLFTLDEFEVFCRKTLDEKKSKWNLSEKQVEKALFTFDKLHEMREQETSPRVAFQRWIAYVRHWLLYTASFGFAPYAEEENDPYIQIMEGTYKDEIITGTYGEGIMRVLKAAMAHYAYDWEGILTLEVACDVIITTLLEKFGRAVLNMGEDVPEREKPNGIQEKLIHLLPDYIVDSYNREKVGKTEEERLFLRMLIVTDFVSSMTDSYAKNLYQEMMGIYY